MSRPKLKRNPEKRRKRRNKKDPLKIMNRAIEKMTDFAENGEKQFFPEFIRVPFMDGQDNILRFRRYEPVNS
jgi:hypothetical protein